MCRWVIIPMHRRFDWFVHKILRLNQNENIVQIDLSKIWYYRKLDATTAHYTFQINNFDTNVIVDERRAIYFSILLLLAVRLALLWLWRRIYLQQTFIHFSRATLRNAFRLSIKRRSSVSNVNWYKTSFSSTRDKEINFHDKEGGSRRKTKGKHPSRFHRRKVVILGIRIRRWRHFSLISSLGNAVVAVTVRRCCYAQPKK